MALSRPQGPSKPAPHDPDVRPHIDAAGLDAPHVERQAKHPMAIGAAQVGLGDQFGRMPASPAGTPAFSKACEIKVRRRSAEDARRGIGFVQ